MNSCKSIFHILFFVGIVICQDIGDLQLENRASDNYQAIENFNDKGESLVTVYSNAAVQQIFVWNTAYQPTIRTFPLKISLPIANRKYTISLYSQTEFDFIENQLKSFNFDQSNIEDFKYLQDKFEKMSMGTKTVRPVNGVDETVFLIYCNENVYGCKDGLHWFDQFYVNYFDNKQDTSFNYKNDKTHNDLIKKHKRGVFSLLGFFTLSIYLIDTLEQ